MIARYNNCRLHSYYNLLVHSIFYLLTCYDFGWLMYGKDAQLQGLPRKNYIIRITCTSSLQWPSNYCHNLQKRNLHEPQVMEVLLMTMTVMDRLHSRKPENLNKTSARTNTGLLLTLL
jgi:hypothetical protein